MNFHCFCLARDLQHEADVKHPFSSVVVALVGLLSGLSVATLSLSRSDLTPGDTKESRPAVPLPARGTYSKGRRQTFEFQSGQEDLLLHYVPGGLLYVNEVVVQLNKELIGFVPASGRGWGIEQRLRLPREQLKRGINRVSFSPKEGHEIEKSWGVRDLYVVPISSKQLPGEGERALYRSAERLFREGGGSLSQLGRAKELLRQVIDKLKLQKRSIPDEADELMRRIVEADAVLYARLMSEARKAASLGDVEKAMTIYTTLLAEVADPNDPRRSEVDRALEAIRS